MNLSINQIYKTIHVTVHKAKKKKTEGKYPYIISSILDI